MQSSTFQEHQQEGQRFPAEECVGPITAGRGLGEVGGWEMEWGEKGVKLDGGGGWNGGQGACGVVVDLMALTDV